MAEWKQIVTPKGIFQYPKFRKADKKYGDFRVSLQLTEEAAKELKKQFRDYAIEVYGPKKGKSAALPKFREDEETGALSLQVSSTRMPAVVDSKGKPVPEKIIVGGGSEGRLAITLRPFAESAERDGVKVMLDAAMVTKLVKFEGASSGAEAFRGFADEDEDGFVVEGGDDEGEEVEDPKPTKGKAKAAKGRSRINDEEDELEDSSDDGEEYDEASI